MGRYDGQKRRDKAAQPKCYVCGDTRRVPTSFVDQMVGIKEGKRLVDCPRCVKIETNNLSKEGRIG